ncbi:MAG: hypothetical protein GX372_00025 [Ignavibacteria bacterium]|jgi:hypothetical protein|nr:hypothetical protein [Ignavibacteria bacterium]
MILRIKIFCILFFFANLHLFADLIVHDIRCNPVNLSKDKSGVLVFVGGYSCKKCFQTLDSIFMKSPAFAKLEKSVLLSCRNNIIVKKETIGNYEKQFSKFNYYFDVSYDNKNDTLGLWNKYDVTITPCVLLYKNNKLKFIPYEKMFATDKNINLEKLLKKELEKL